MERSVVLAFGTVLDASLKASRPSAEVQSLKTATAEDAERDNHIYKTFGAENWVVSGLNGAVARLGLKRSAQLSVSRVQRLEL
jgi:hypothetical protein